MSILIGLIASLIAQLGKKLAAKFGQDVETEVIYLFLFVVALLYALTGSNPTVADFVQKGLTVVSAAIATYELILSRIGFLLPPPPVAATTSPTNSDTSKSTGVSAGQSSGTGPVA